MGLSLEVKKFIIYLKFKPIKHQRIGHDGKKFTAYAYYTPENRLWCYYNHKNSRLLINRGLIDGMLVKINSQREKKINIVDFEEKFIQMVANNYGINLLVNFVIEDRLIKYVNEN